MKKFLLILTFFGLCSAGVLAQKKPAYSLFKAVPKDSLREMETDRPDVTETPQTVDAGHFQVETDLFRFQRQGKETGKTDEYFFNQANLKLGLTGSTAIQVTLESYVLQKEFDGAGNMEQQHGFGDVTLRLKQNLLGNNDGKFAIALLPYLKFPTSRADDESQYEGGVIIPMRVKFNKQWTLGFQVEADRLQDEEGMGHHNEILQTVALSNHLSKKLEAIVETYYTYEFKEKHMKNFLNAAIQYEIAKDMLLDGGVNYGLQQEAKKTYFVGLSFRL